MIVRRKEIARQILNMTFKEYVDVTFNDDGEIILQKGQHKLSLDFSKLIDLLPFVTLTLHENADEVYYRIAIFSYYVETGLDFSAHPDKLKWFIRGELPSDVTLPIPLKTFKHIQFENNKLKHYIDPEHKNQDLANFIIDFSDIINQMSYDTSNNIIYLYLPKSFNIDPVIASDAYYYVGHTNQNFFFKFNGYYYVFWGELLNDVVYYAYSADAVNWTIADFGTVINLRLGYGRELSAVATSQKIFLATIEDGYAVSIRTLTQNADGSLSIETTTQLSAGEDSIISGAFVLSCGVDDIPYLAYLCTDVNDNIYIKAWRSSSSISWVEDTAFTLYKDITLNANLYTYNNLAISGNGQYGLIVYTDTNTNDVYYIRYDSGVWSSVVSMAGYDGLFPSIIWASDTVIYIPFCYKDIKTYIYDVIADSAIGYYLWGNPNLSFIDRAGRFAYDPSLDVVIGFDFTDDPAVYLSEFDRATEDTTETLMDVSPLTLNTGNYQMINILLDEPNGKIHLVWGDTTGDNINLFTYQYKTVTATEVLQLITEGLGVSETEITSIDTNIIDSIVLNEDKRIIWEVGVNEGVIISEQQLIEIIKIFLESINALESDTKTVTARLTDLTTLSESVSKELIKQFVEFVSLLEELNKLYSMIILESVSVVEDIYLEVFSKLLENINLNESISYELTAAFLESLGLTELFYSTTEVLQVLTEILESVTLSEGLTGEIEGIIKEIFSLAETFNKVINHYYSDTIMISESDIVNILSLLTDTVLVIEEVSTLYNAVLLFLEQIQLTDDKESLLSLTFSEFMELSEEFYKALGLQFNEGVSLDDLTKRINVLTLLIEALGVSDSPELEVYLSFIEGVGLSDTLSFGDFIMTYIALKLISKVLMSKLLASELPEGIWLESKVVLEKQLRSWIE